MAIKRLVFALLPALAVCAALEVGARLLVAESPYAASGLMGWTMQPGLVDYRVVGLEGKQRPFVVSTNSDGLRTTHPRERAPGVKRLVTFGDSTIFGWGVTPEEAPAGVLEAALGAGWEVINAGQPGFSSEQARRLAVAVIAAYQPDGVIWFHPWHDLATVQASDREQLPAAAQPQLWWEGSRFLSALWSRQVQAAPEASEDPLFPFVPLNQPSGIPRVSREQRAENLAAVQQTAAAGGAWVIAAVLPSPETLDYQRPPKSYQQEIQRHATAAGASYVELSETVAGMGSAALTLKGDPGHYTAAGNRLLMVPILEAVRASAAQ